MKKQALICLAIGLGITAPPVAAMSAEEASELAGQTGCAMLASFLVNPTAAAAAAGGCVFGTEIISDGIGSFIDAYFDGDNQALADQLCATIVVDGMRFEPATRENCEE